MIRLQPLPGPVASKMFVLTVLILLATTGQAAQQVQGRQTDSSRVSASGFPVQLTMLAGRSSTVNERSSVAYSQVLDVVSSASGLQLKGLR